MRVEVRTDSKAAGEILATRLRSNRIALVTPDNAGDAIVTTRMFVGTPDLNGTGVLVTLDANGVGYVTVYAGQREQVFRAKIVGGTVEVSDPGVR